MKAIIYDDFGDLSNLKVKEVTTPHPEDDQVQIHVKYAGVNPVDWKIMEGWLKDFLPHQLPIIPGWDAAGTISAIGKNTTKFKIGDVVFAYCRPPTVHAGTFADYVCFPAEHVALAPKNLSLAEASSIPLVSLTAWQSLFEFGKLEKGQTALIHAGAGGVGGMAIGFAKNIGAKVYTTASEKNHPYVKKLGCHVAIDYRTKNFVDEMKSLEPHGVDFLFDCVGSETLEESYQLVKPGGHLVSIVTPPNEEMAAKYKIHVDYAFVRPDGSQLKQIANLLDSKKITPPDIHKYPFEKAAEALAEVRKGHTRGKVVLIVNP